MAQSKKLIQPGDELKENWWKARHKYPHKSPYCRNPQMTCTHGRWNTTDLQLWRWRKRQNNLDWLCNEQKPKFFCFSTMCKTWGRIRIRIGIKMEDRIRIRIRIGIDTIPIHNTDTITRAKNKTFITFVDPIYSLGTLYLWKLKQNHLHARVDVNVSWMIKSFYNKNSSSGIKAVFVTARGHDDVPVYVSVCVYIV